jgi:hypothetical protein
MGLSPTAPKGILIDKIWDINGLGTPSHIIITLPCCPGGVGGGADCLFAAGGVRVDFTPKAVRVAAVEGEGGGGHVFSMVIVLRNNNW